MVNKINIGISWLLFSFSVINVSARSIPNNFTLNSNVQKFISYMNHKHNFDQKELQELFEKFNVSSDVLYKITHPSEKLSWGQYKKLLLSSSRMTQGKAFLINNKEILEQVELQFGVPKEIIVAILGVESSYGKIVGAVPVLQSLATLAFHYPPREKFFKQELEHFLLLAKEEGLPYTVTGSYAGAMSPAQFMPSSYRNYAIDFADVGTKDLNNMKNAIGSIANYFVKNGWKSKQDIACLAKFKHSSANNLKNHLEESSLAKSTAAKYCLDQLQQVGLDTAAFNQNQLKQQVVLIELLDDSNNKQYWLGFDNFCVITKYNRSIHYAMVVYQLAVELGLAN